MASTRKSSAAAPKKAKQVKLTVAAKTAKTKVAANKALDDKSPEDLVVDNFAALTQVVESLSETIEMLVEKAESMAFHIIAMEQMLAELVAENGINLARVNARIRLIVPPGTQHLANAGKSIDLAAAIASPLPRR